MTNLLSIHDINSLIKKNEISTLNLALPTNLPVHLYIKDRKGNFDFANDTLAKDIGFSNGDALIGHSDLDLSQEKDAFKIMANDQRIMLSEKPDLLYESATLLTNKKVIVCSQKIPLRDKMNKVIGIFGMSLFKVISDSTSQTDNPFALTPRQIDCLYYLIQGMSIKQIASELELSPRTVEHYLNAAKNKMGYTTRSELINSAWKMPVIKEKLRTALNEDYNN